MARVHGVSSRAIIGRFYETLEGVMQGGWINRLAMTVQSDQESETYRWLGMAPALREWKGGRLAKSLRTNGITIENKKWEATLAIDADDARRDKTGQIQVRIDEMADRVADHPHKLLSMLITNGHNKVCYDNQYFFDTDHSEGDSGVQKNLLTSSEIEELAVGSETAPTPAEFSIAILHVIGWMFGFKDDQGEPMNGNAREFLVQVPVTLWPSAYQAAAKDMLFAAAGAVAPNVLKGGDLKVDVVCNPLLTWTKEFGVFRTDGRAKPFIYQVELPLQVKAVAEGSEHEFDEDEHKYGVKTIHNAGYGLWQHAVKAEFTTA